MAYQIYTPASKATVYFKIQILKYVDFNPNKVFSYSCESTISYAKRTTSIDIVLYTIFHSTYGLSGFSSKIASIYPTVRISLKVK